MNKPQDVRAGSLGAQPEVMTRPEVRSRLQRWRLAVLRAFAVAERPAAWGLLIGAAWTFIGVLVGWITVGDFKWPTLLIAADLVVSGFAAVQDSEDGAGS